MIPASHGWSLPVGLPGRSISACSARRPPGSRFCSPTDRYDPRAIEMLQRHIAAAPKVDFFHSARREIDAEGRRRGPIQPSRSRITAAAFRTLGSPVKHSSAGDGRGGSPSAGWTGSHRSGPTTTTFRGACSRPAAASTRSPSVSTSTASTMPTHRITTHHPLRAQLTSLAAMFRKHEVPHSETSAYLQHAIDTYLVKEMFFDFEDDWRKRVSVSCYREAGAERLADFRAAGYQQRHVFPHRVYQLPKGGIDGLKLAQRMSGIVDPARLAQLVLFGLPPVIERLPPEIFFDDDVQWHQQHYGRVGQVASANVAFDGDRLFGSLYISDLVQRISRRRELKNRVRNVFKGWHGLLLNALMNVALDRGIRFVYSPTAALAMTHTDPKRTVHPQLFVRVYDTAVREHFVAEVEVGWWRIDVAANRDRIVCLDKDVEVTPRAEDHLLSATTSSAATAIARAIPRWRRKRTRPATPLWIACSQSSTPPVCVRPTASSVPCSTRCAAASSLAATRWPFTPTTTSCSRGASSRARFAACGASIPIPTSSSAAARWTIA